MENTDYTALLVARLKRELAMLEAALRLACEDASSRWAALIEGEQPKVVYTGGLHSRSASEYYDAYIERVQQKETLNEVAMTDPLVGLCP